MKTAFLRKYISSVCVAALIAGVSAPANAASSIEINLDVLEKSSKPAPAAAPARKEEAKPVAPASKKAESKPVEKSKKPAIPKKETKPAKPAPVKETKPAPVKEIPHTEHKTPVPAPAPAVVVPPMPAELPPIKDLPNELTPTPPELNVLPADPIRELPTPVTVPTDKVPALPTAPELPKPEATAPLPVPGAPATSAAPAEPAKPGLGDQLSDFISGKPSTPAPAPGNLPTPPELPHTLPPGTPAAPKIEVAPATLPTPPTVSEMTRPTLMGSPLPDANLKSGSTTTKPAETAPASAAIPPAPKEPEAPMAVGTPMALPTLTPAPLPTEKKPETAPELPESAIDATPPALPEPAPSGLPEPEKPALPPVSDAIAPPATQKSDLTLPDDSSALAEPNKMADIPDLIPLPDNARGDLPSLPSGTQEDLLSAAPRTDSANKALLEQMSKKDSSSTDPDMRLIFSESETDVSQALFSQLDTVAAKLEQSPGTRVNILSYAGGKNENGIYPKRVSLARGIAVRNYLTTTKGIDIERVNVRALGNKSEGAAADRVDLFLVK